MKDQIYFNDQLSLSCLRQPFDENEAKEEQSLRSCFNKIEASADEMCNEEHQVHLFLDNYELHQINIKEYLDL